ncbi:MAG TPA: secretin and TonB N-terminal domain-containing protein [Gemmatimonadaceae bacterium]|nr:secretin and TonB N-terminal domain-containing protein [Gemmatimonadaceae bacterium]
MPNALYRNFNISSLIRTSIASAAAAALVACASGGAATRPHATVRVEPVTAQSDGEAVAQSGTAAPSTGAAAPAAAPALPALSANPAIAAAPERRLQVDLAPGTSIASAVQQIGTQMGLSVSVDPAVTGTTQTSLRNVTLDEALRELVTKNGYAYQLQGNVLRVVPVRMQTKTFHLDYVALSRVGTMSTVVQRRLTSGGSFPQVGTATGLSATAPGASTAVGGGDVLTAQSVADVWQEIRVALTGILAAGQPPAEARDGSGPAVQQTNTPTQNQAGGFGSGAATVQFRDGSSLVISPMSGLINVTAMPDKLADVEKFIDEFQASVMREVQIEAKIVEVTFTSSNQFGIDWSIVSNAASGKYGVTLRSNPTAATSGNTGNVNFMLTGGSTQINAVVNALSSQGNVEVLNDERAATLNNQRAIFNVTTDQVFFSVTQTPLLGPTGGVVSVQSQVIPQQISVGVVLDVTPQISADNVLTMDIRPSVTSIDHVETITLPDGTTASAPAIGHREGDTVARLRAGETMIVGGLVQSQKQKTKSGIPGLKDIPFLGKIFTHYDDTETRSELVVFLTPTIIAGQPVTGR